jgi:hypothetical protein
MRSSTVSKLNVSPSNASQLAIFTSYRSLGATGPGHDKSMCSPGTSRDPNGTQIPYGPASKPRTTAILPAPRRPRESPRGWRRDDRRARARTAGQPWGRLGPQSGQAIVQSTPRSRSMNFGGEAVFGERVGHGDCGSSVRSRPSWVRHPCPSSKPAYSTGRGRSGSPSVRSTPTPATATRRP